MHNRCKTYSPILILLCSVLAATPLPAFSQETISACGHPNYPPWSWRQGDKIVGVCAEISRRMFEAQGITVVHIDAGTWKRCQKQVENGTIDINICSHINEDRQRYSIFMETPIGINEIGVFVKKGQEFPFNTWQDLSGKRTALVLGVSMGQEFDAFMENNTPLIRVADRLQAFNMQLKARVDFVATWRQLGEIQLRQAGLDSEFVPLPPLIVRDNLYLSMSKSSPFRKYLAETEKQLKQPEYGKLLNSLLEKYSNLYVQDQSKQE